MYTIQELGGPENTESEATNINARGDVSGIAFDATAPVEGVVWSGASPLFSLTTTSLLYSVNDTDVGVGTEGEVASDTQKAFFTVGGVVTDLSPVVGVGTIANDINTAGLACGWGWNSPDSFVVDTNTSAIFATIPPLPGAVHSFATAINGAGGVVGGSRDSQGKDHGFFYGAGTLTDLGPAAFVEDINDSGVVCGSIGKPWPQAFSPGVWDSSTDAPVFSEIPVPPGFLGGHASGINTSGDVVGACWTPETYNRDSSAYIYSGGVSTVLDTLITAGSGWHLQYAEAINDKGQITGTGLLNGQRRAFLLTPIERSPFANLPAIIALLIFGGVTIDGGGWVVPPGGGPVPVGPWGERWASLPSATRDALIGLAVDALALNVEDASLRDIIRRSALEGVRTQVDLMLKSLETNGGGVLQRGTGARMHLQSGKSLNALARFGARSSQ